MSNMHDTSPATEIANGFAPTPADGKGVPTSMMWASGEDNFTPWSAQYGTYVGQELVDSSTALSMAGLDWGVDTAPLFIQGPEVYRNAEGEPILDMEGNPIPKPLQLKDNRCMVKDTDYTAFGVVGSRYHPIQNADAFQFLDGLVEDGELRYHTAGSLKGGRVVWILGQLQGNLEPVKGDPVGKFLLFSNTHDGSGALRIFWTSIRVCCMNTWRHALQEGRGKGITLKHTATIKNRLEQAREVLGLTRQAYDQIGEHLSELAKVQMTSQALDNMVMALAPHPSDADPEAELPTRTKNTRIKLVELFESGIGSDIKGVRGTAYQALNMATEYTNHHRGTWKNKGADHKLHNIWFGSSNDFHIRAESWLDQYMMGYNPEDITRSLTQNSYHGQYTLAEAESTQQQRQLVTLN
jgi:phage/plasmid-like protein (TIGR03299 family)